MAKVISRIIAKLKESEGFHLEAYYRKAEDH